MTLDNLKEKLKELKYKDKYLDIEIERAIEKSNDLQLRKIVEKDLGWALYVTKNNTIYTIDEKRTVKRYGTRAILPANKIHNKKEVLQAIRGDNP